MLPVVVAAVVLVGVVVVVAAGGGGDGGGKAVEIAKNVDVSGSTLPTLTTPRSDPAVGRKAPGLAGVGFDGDSVSVEPGRRPMALVFLAHWCPHCQAELPRIVSLAKAKGMAGVDVVGIATGTSPDRPNYPPSKWFDREGWPFPVLVDDAQSSAGQAYGLSAYPFLVFVDANGNVAGRMSGEISQANLGKIFSALADGDPLPLPAGGSASPG